MDDAEPDMAEALAELEFDLMTEAEYEREHRFRDPDYFFIPDGLQIPRQLDLQLDLQPDLQPARPFFRHHWQHEGF